MKISRAARLGLLVVALFLVACADVTPTETIPNSTPPPLPTSAVPATLGASETPFAPPSTPAATVVAVQAYCKNGGAVQVAPNDKLAAKVNGQGIPLSLYDREAQQEQATLLAQGAVDPKTKTGQDAIKGLHQQVLGQLIDDVLVEQAAQAEQVSVTAADVNGRIQQMINDAGGRDKFDNYLKTTQMTLDDLCTQIRASMFGEVMLNRVTAALPTQVEQVHAAHILLASQADANQVLAALKAGKDYAALAKQYSKDEATRDNGGDLGWFPKGIMPPEFEAVAFQLQPGQISGVVSTSLGFHIIKVIEHAASRQLSPELLQNQKQQAFLAWLDAQRNKSKIENLVNP